MQIKRSAANEFVLIRLQGQLTNGLKTVDGDSTKVCKLSILAYEEIPLRFWDMSKLLVALSPQLFCKSVSQPKT